MDINSKKIPNIIDITSLSIEWTILAPKGANNIVTGTKIINPGKFTKPILNGTWTFEKNVPLIAILTAPQTAFTMPIVAEVPIAIFIEYPKTFINGTPSEPAPMPNGTDIKPMKTPYVFLTKFGIFFFFSPTLFLKKIKKIATQNAKNENINKSWGVFRFVAMNVPIKIPIATAIPKDLTNLKFTALYFIWDNADTIDVGIIIASEVPRAMCILTVSS